MPSGGELFRMGRRGVSSEPVEDLSGGARVVLDCVERGLFGMLGESAEAATLYFIGSRGGMKLSNIPDNPDWFVESLRNIFGLGTDELLRAILRELRAKEGGRAKDKVQRQFAEALESAIRSIEDGIV
jgi:hypothetical protein